MSSWRDISSVLDGKASSPSYSIHESPPHTTVSNPSPFHSPSWNLQKSASVWRSSQFTVFKSGQLGLTEPSFDCPSSVIVMDCSITLTFFRFGNQRLCCSFIESFYSSGQFLHVQNIEGDVFRFHVPDPDSPESWIEALDEAISTAKDSSPLASRVSESASPSKESPRLSLIKSLAPLEIPSAQEDSTSFDLFKKDLFRELQSPPLEHFSTFS
ncbi:hypothetical protein GEMRC1_009250 [Eukaryota sp. GEM-RC1]